VVWTLDRARRQGGVEIGDSSLRARPPGNSSSVPIPCLAGAPNVFRSWIMAASTNAGRQLSPNASRAGSRHWEVAASLNERGKANRRERPPRRGGLAQQGDLGRGQGIPHFAFRTPHSAARQGFGSARTGGGDGAGVFIAQKHDNQRPLSGATNANCQASARPLKQPGWAGCS
jgi:hypothetical protein